MEVQRLYTAKDMADALHQSGAVRIGETADAFPMTNTDERTGIKWDIENVLSRTLDHKRKVVISYLNAFAQLNEGRHPGPLRIVGIPDGMNTIASSMADVMGTGQLVVKKAEVKAGNAHIYGEADIEGKEFDINFAEDVFTTGKSTADTVLAFTGKGHRIAEIVGLVARNKYAVEALSDKVGKKAHALYTAVELGEALALKGAINEEQLGWIKADFEKSIPRY